MCGNMLNTGIICDANLLCIVLCTEKSQKRKWRQEKLMLEFEKHKEKKAKTSSDQTDRPQISQGPQTPSTSGRKQF